MNPKKSQPLPAKSARNIAVNALLAYDHEEQWLQDYLDSAFQRVPLDPRDARLAMELALGSCRHLKTLDLLLEKHSSRALKKVAPTVLQILRVGLYQMLYLSATPDFAAVNEAVQQGKQCAVTGVHTFINAVLRSVQRDIDRIEATDKTLSRRNVLITPDQQAIHFKSEFLPDPQKKPGKFLSAAYSHPLWLVERWLKRLHFDTVLEICQANNRRPPLTLRPNRVKCDAARLLEMVTDKGIRAHQIGAAVQLEGSAAIRDLPGFAEGLFMIQDLTAMSIAPVLDCRPGQRVLDLCAAPGGKATHLAELMNNEGTVIATDVNDAKLDLIRQNVARLGLDIVQPTLVDDLDSIMAQGGPFEAILLDVPCSNTGVLSRRVEARHALKPNSITELAEIQRQLLDRAVALLAPGGKMLYSTCSIEPNENDQQIQAFLTNHPEFRLAAEALTLPGTTPQVDAEPSNDNQSATNHAWTAWHDGGYYALLQHQA